MGVAVAVVLDFKIDVDGVPRPPLADSPSVERSPAEVRHHAADRGRGIAIEVKGQGVLPTKTALWQHYSSFDLPIPQARSHVLAAPLKRFGHRLRMLDHPLVDLVGVGGVVAVGFPEGVVPVQRIRYLECVARCGDYANGPVEQRLVGQVVGALRPSVPTSRHRHE